MRSIKADIVGTFLSKAVNKKMGRTIPPNSFNAEAPTEKKEWGSHHIRINDVCYGKEYPNSYMDIYLPDADTTIKRPVLLYAHGGGFLFCGKSTGDVIAQGTDNTGDIQGMFQWFLSEGVIVISMEYAMAPKYRFPVAILQMDQALRFMTEHTDEYGLDMNRIMLGGSSAGANMTEIYSCMVHNLDYAKRIGVDKTAIGTAQLKCALVDESALTDGVPMEKNEKILEMVWMGDKDLTSCTGKKIAYISNWIQNSYPPTFITSSNKDVWFYNSTKPFYDKLRSIGVDCDFYYPDKSKGVYDHGFMLNYANDDVANECYTRMQKFVKIHFINEKERVSYNEKTKETGI